MDASIIASLSAVLIAAWAIRRVWIKTAEYRRERAIILAQAAAKSRPEHSHCEGAGWNPRWVICNDPECTRMD